MEKQDINIVWYKRDLMYNVWRKMKPNAKAELLEQAEYYLKNMNEL